MLYVEVYLTGIPIEMLVDCGSNATTITVEAFNKIKLMMLKQSLMNSKRSMKKFSRKNLKVKLKEN